MIISRTPYRISLFGGGTDYPSWYRKHGGAVLATSIDKYCYLTCRYLPPFFEHRMRFVYSKIENCKTIDEIKHPSIRECLRYLGIDRGLEIHHDGDLPARSGMGSSSSFTVGLLNALYALTGSKRSKQQLAEEAIHVEQNCIKETVGSQDQVTAAYGGLNRITFCPNGDIEVCPLNVDSARLQELNCRLLLFYTGIIRTASDVAASYVTDICAKKRQLETMRSLVEESITVLTKGSDIAEFGALLHEAWEAKRSLSSLVTNPAVDDLYARARNAGATGGKLIGAGGGGFLLLFVPQDRREHVIRELDDLIHVPFQFEFSGSRIIFVDRQQNYEEQERIRAHQCVSAFRELKTEAE